MLRGPFPNFILLTLVQASRSRPVAEGSEAGIEQKSHIPTLCVRESLRKDHLPSNCLPPTSHSQVPTHRSCASHSISATHPSIYPLTLSVYCMLVLLCHIVDLQVELETTSLYWAWGGIAFSIVTHFLISIVISCNECLPMAPWIVICSKDLRVTLTTMRRIIVKQTNKHVGWDHLYPKSTSVVKLYTLKVTI